MPVYPLKDFPSSAKAPQLDEVVVPGEAGWRIRLIGVEAFFDDPDGGSGTLVLRVGSHKRWEAPVNGGMSIYFPEEILAPDSVGVSVECEGALIRLRGSYRVTHPRPSL